MADRYGELERDEHSWRITFNGKKYETWDEGKSWSDEGGLTAPQAVGLKLSNYVGANGMKRLKKERPIVHMIWRCNNGE